MDRIDPGRTTSDPNSSNEVTMRQQWRLWPGLAAITAFLAVGSHNVSAQDADKLDPPRRLTPEIGQAWKDAFAEIGWMTIRDYDDQLTFTRLRFGVDKI